MGAIVFVTVLMVTIPICFFIPTPEDDLNINQSSDDLYINQSLVDLNINQSLDDLNINQSPDDLNIKQSTNILYSSYGCTEEVENDTKYKGAQILNEKEFQFNVANFGQCRDICKQTAGCKTWSYVPPFKYNCLIKGHVEERIYEPGIISGNVCQVKCLHEDGVDYDGMVSETVSGRTCQNWKRQSPHKHQRGYLGNNNYCRNPSGHSTIWCYTTDPQKEWENCADTLCDVNVICPQLVVSNADYAKCNGEYRFVGKKVKWAPSRPVYKLVNRNRYIFWDRTVSGWSIGNLKGLTTGGGYHSSGLNTKEPWQGVWKGEDPAVQVKCKTNLENRWRDDGKCGVSNPVFNDKPGQCDPSAENGPCCSQFGQCGNSEADCNCPTCVNYTEVDVICSDLLVSHADYANCNGAYRVTGLKVDWNPNRPVWKQINGDRYIYLNTGSGGWSISGKEGLTDRTGFFHSNLHTKEPWQGEWIPAGVEVKCIEISDFINGQCYAEDFRFPLHFHYHDLHATNSPEKCAETCRSTGYLYAVVELGDSCLCTHGRPLPYIEDTSQCYRDCPGDKSKKCGGVKRFNVYRTDDNVLCPDLVVSNADYGDCNGDYHYDAESKVKWAPNRPVYKLINQDRYMFWNIEIGWSIGNSEGLTNGGDFHNSHLDSKEPWQGIWINGVKVECKEQSEPELLHEGGRSIYDEYNYYKVPVKTGVVLLSSVIQKTCEMHKMKAQCYGRSKRYSDRNCQIAPDAEFPADKLAELICGQQFNTPELCLQLDQTFWYVRGLADGAAYGLSQGKFILGRNITTTSHRQYYAACLHIHSRT